MEWVTTEHLYLLATILAVLSAFVTIVGYLTKIYKLKSKGHWVCFGIMLLASCWIGYQVQQYTQDRIQDAKEVAMQERANRIVRGVGSYDSVASKSLANLSSIASFFEVYKDIFPREYEHYSHELVKWREHARKELEKEKRNSYETRDGIRGVVDAGVNELRQIANTMNYK